ncbi:MAG: flagellar basal body rod protein FlgB, partial [Kiloniellales bacterium]
DPGHIVTPAAAGAGGAKVEKEKDVYEITPSGNAVIVEEQMIKAAETQNHYQLITNLYRKHKEMLRLAVSGGQ